MFSPEKTRSRTRTGIGPVWVDESAYAGVFGMCRFVVALIFSTPQLGVSRGALRLPQEFLERA